MKKTQKSKLRIDIEVIRVLAQLQMEGVKGGETISPNPCGGSGSVAPDNCTGTNVC